MLQRSSHPMSCPPLSPPSIRALTTVRLRKVPPFPRRASGSVIAVAAALAIGAVERASGPSCALADPSDAIVVMQLVPPDGHAWRNEPAEPLNVGTTLRFSDVVSTDSSTWMQLLFLPAYQLWLAPGSRLALDHVQTEPSSARLVLHLLAGRIRATLAHLGLPQPPVSVETETVIAAPRGTDLVMSRGDSGSTTVGVLEGQVLVRTRSGLEWWVNAGEFLTVAPDGSGGTVQAARPGNDPDAAGLPEYGPGSPAIVDQLPGARLTLPPSEGVGANDAGSARGAGDAGSAQGAGDAGSAGGAGDAGSARGPGVFGLGRLLPRHDRSGVDGDAEDHRIDPQELRPLLMAPAASCPATLMPPAPSTPFSTPK